VTGISDLESLGEADVDQVCGVRGGGTATCWGAVSDVMPAGVRLVDSAIDRPEFGDVVDIAASVRFECALRSDGVVVCRGSNEFGQLGDGTMMGRDEALAVPRLP
jgi:hypothetical protein